jgi:hypothetical protein
MDFPTRDRYRHAVEAIARHSRFTEPEVAREAVELAEGGARELGSGHRAAHVGYYLIDRGRARLESTAAVRWPWQTAVERGIQRFPLLFYAGGIFLFTALGSFVLRWQMQSIEVEPWKGILLAILFVLCASQLAVALVNWLSTLLVRPRLLPRLDYSSGITPDGRSMVVVPTMLTSLSGVDQLVETLEIHYLANRDPNLHFALLTDFRDAPAERMPEDDGLLRRAREGVELLNRKYLSDPPNIFFLFHRPRRWNEREGVWMGYERKRGKLTEFNALLRGRGRDCFSEIVGDLAILPGIRFVLTLDTDTQLPRDAARQLAGTMAHPLNRPQFDPVTGIVTEGYSILQPRVGVSLPSAGRSWFVRLFAGEVGIDPYTRTVSDVYQDVFQQGSFIGKGMYDVEAFERALAGRFPENAVLSHDLIESCHARSALVSDVELYEEYPSRYNADVNRRHRWIRGDWQIAQWLLPRVPGPEARRIANPLSGLSQWKIFDNLRRSLVPAALTLLLLGNWMLLPELGGLGPLLALSIILIPGLLSMAVEALRKPEELPLSLHLEGLAKSGGRQLGQAILALVFLPHDAYISLDAIGRTLWRLLFTRKRLLEWQTASEAERTAGADLAGFCAAMWIAPAIALLAGCYLALEQPNQLPVAGPLLGLWFISPWIAWRISQSIETPAPALRPEQRAFLRRTARKTWRFFETFVNAQENWLPPDNFQEHPVPLVASRTSPTNMGLALLANLAAWDFGYVSMGRLVRLTENAFATMQRLERYRGHFYNWYETRTLKPLLPLYVSSVDSGNLAGHLLTLGSGLAELPEQPILPPGVFAGLRDTVGLLLEQTGRDQDLERLERELERGNSTLSAGLALLRRTADQAARIAAERGDADGEELKWWTQALARDCREHLEDLKLLAPWLDLPFRAAFEQGFPPAGSSSGVERPGGITGRSPDGKGPGSTPGASSAATELADKLGRLDEVPTLRAVSQLGQSLCPLIEEVLHSASRESAPLRKEERRRLGEWLHCLREASERASQRIHALEMLARQSVELADMDFTFLFDPARELFSIGFNVSEHRRDSSYYDLLASEARLCSYVAIAQGQVSQDHWFSLGRLLVASHGVPVLASWNGSLFEYLMPLLVMPNYEATLLDQTYRGVVERQIEYGVGRGVPWGISESGYNRTDIHLNYQYRAFGVPGLGLKRGLAEDLVIAPYAAMMALMVAPRQACENLERLTGEGREGAYGFYEAVDYTPSRLPPDQSSVTIRSFMAHHQGMGLLALAYLLLNRPMQRRFMSCPLFRAADLLLQERVPNIAAKVLSEDLESGILRRRAADGEGVMRVFTNPGLPAPEVHLLSNGRYHVVVSSAGGGYSRWRDLAVTRWREDATRDDWGTFVYLRDAATGEFWSAAYQPALRTTKRYEAIFTQARAEFRQHQAGLEIHTEISVSPEDDVELRRV